MLKSEVKIENKKKELGFPKLMISNYGRIILATSINGNEIKGFLIYEKVMDECCPILQADCWSADVFTDFYGSITLTQTPE